MPRFSARGSRRRARCTDEDAWKRIVIRKRSRIDVEDRNLGFAFEKCTQRTRVGGGQPFLRNDHAIAAARSRQPMRELDEVDVEIGDAVVARERPQRELACGRELLLADVWGIAQDCVELWPCDR